MEKKKLSETNCAKLQNAKHEEKNIKRMAYKGKNYL